MLVVKFMKYFVDGSLKRLTYETELPVANLTAATEYVKHCHEHVETPVKTDLGSSYTIHNARVSWKPDST